MNPEEQLIEMGQDVWIANAPATIVGMALTTTMTVLRYGTCDLVVYSPVGLNNQLRAEIQKLGKVAHIYVPNLFHHLHVGGFIEAFPGAKVHAPGGLERKRPDLRIDRVQSTDAPWDLAGVVDELPIHGFRLKETVLFHRSTGTLVVADLIQNIGRPQGIWPATYSRLMGFYDRVALSRALRYTAFSDGAAARRAIESLLALPLRRIIVGHGAPLLENAREALRQAYDFLPNESAP